MSAILIAAAIAAVVAAIFASRLLCKRLTDRLIERALDEYDAKATQIYVAAKATASADALTACFRQPEAQGLPDESVQTDAEHDVWEDLHSALQDLYRSRARGAA
jgi:hypothetical protein